MNGDKAGKQLTKENASRAASVRSIESPEWGTKRLGYNTERLAGNLFASSIGSGCNSRILDDSEFHLWEVVSWK